MIEVRERKAGTRVCGPRLAAGIVVALAGAGTAQRAGAAADPMVPAQTVEQVRPAGGMVTVPALSLDQAAAGGSGEPASAAQPQADKSSFNLFNPVPTNLLREFNTDRPDVTESPFTVDAGHYQMELSFVEYTHDGGDAARTDGFSVLPANLRIGLLNNLELDLMPNPYLNILVHGRGVSQRLAGAGDTAIRAKLNLWGNDGGATAGGIIPFVKIPTGTGGISDHHVEGGVIFPLAVSLPAGFDLGTMAEFDLDRNDANDGYGVDFIHTITIGHELFEKLSAYVEYVGVSPIATGHTYLAYADTGLTYLLHENVQVDVGVNRGISGRANDFTFFTGLSLRF